MELKDFIKTQPRDQVLFIGSGSGFFFIGTPVEYRRYLKTINDAYKNALACQEQKKKQDLSLFLRVLGIPSEGENSIYRKEKELQDLALSAKDARMRLSDVYSESDNRLLKCLPLMMHGLYKACTQYIKVRDQLRNYQHLQYREVLETYKRAIYKDGLVVRVDGTENGGFWFRSEFQSATKHPGCLVFDLDTDESEE